MTKNKFHKIVAPQENSKIGTTLMRNKNTEDHSEYVKVSFKYLLSDNASYSYVNKKTGYFIKLVERLAAVCKMTCSELKYPKLRALRNHFINWADTTQQSFGLPNEDQLVDRPFQLGISANEHGRLIGFFIDKTFYIVWFDTEHNIYA